MPSYVQFAKQVAMHSLSFYTGDRVLVADKPTGSSDGRLGKKCRSATDPLAANSSTRLGTFSPRVLR